MIRQRTAFLAFLLLPVIALAQGEEGGLGLDLTEEPKKEEKKEEDVIPQPTTPPPADTPPREVVTRKEDPAAGERTITQDDRVKAVQRKLYLKKRRFELNPSVSYSVNDPYYSKAGAAVRLGYYLQDSLSIGVRGAWLNVIPSDDVRTAKRNFQSRIFFSVPQWAVMANVEWSPIYGKVAIFNSILHFDGYLTAGPGVVSTETSALRGLNPAVDLGGGLRFVAKDFLAVNAALINTSYVDIPTGSPKAATQNILTLNAGISLFLPLKSTTRESE